MFIDILDLDPESKYFTTVCYTGRVSVRLSPILIVATLIGAARAARAEGDDAPAIFGDHPGYTRDIGYERNTRTHEMVMLRKEEYDDKPLAEVIFDEKLSREFQQQYENKFGTTQAEQVINSPGRYDQYTFNSGRNATLTDYRRSQQKFGEYMARRLLEHHVEQYAKRDKGFRQVYEFKDRVSNVEIKTKNGWNVKYKYNLAGPTMDVEVRNPYDIELRARVEMSGLVSSPTEVIYRLGYQLTPRVRLSEMIKQVDGIYQTVLSRQMTAHIAMSLSASFDASPRGPSIQQNIFLVGFSWSE